VGVTTTAVDLLHRKSKEKGLLGDSSAWLGVWVAVVGGRWLYRAAQRKPVVVREVLRPGEQLVISHFPKGADVAPLPKKGRKG
jgi:hypothetical protein